MKALRSYTLDIELIERMKNEKLNASGLINSLLREHFDAEVSDDKKILEAKKLELENDREIKDKKIEHLTNKLIVLKHKENEDKTVKSYEEQMKIYKVRVEELNDRWKNQEFDTGIIDERGFDLGDSEYWKRMSELQKRKPLKINEPKTETIPAGEIKEGDKIEKVEVDSEEIQKSPSIVNKTEEFLHMHEDENVTK